MTRIEYIDWCKSKALDCIYRGDTEEGLISLLNGLGKHEDTKGTNIVEEVLFKLQHYKETSISETIKFIRELK